MSREMKHSGIVEGFNIPLQWKTMKFGKICSVVTDFVASGSFADLRANVTYLSEPDYAMLIRTTDLAKTARSEGKVYISKESYEFLSNSNLFGGEVVLPNIGSIGDAYIVPKLYERMSLAPNAIMFKTHYCDKYYYYYFLSKVGKLQLDEISQSTAIAKFNKTDLKQLRVVLPSLSEQQKIASFLDRKCAEIDEMITLQERVVDELKAYKQSVITEAVTKGLNPDVPMKDSGIEWIGEIPEHWKVDLLSLLFEEHKQKNTGLLCKNLLSLSYGKIVRKNIDSVGGLLPQSYDGYNVVDKGDIVFRLTDLQNDKKSLRTGLVRERGIVTSAYVTLRSRKSVLSAYYQYLFHSYDVMKVFYGMGDGVRQGMNYGDLRKMLIVTPPHSEQNEIVEFLDAKCTEIDNLISIKLSKIDSLKEYKKSIIYEYVTGKKEVIE